MNFLITGISGYIGRSVASEAIRRGHAIWGLVRNVGSVRSSSGMPSVHWIQGDLSLPFEISWPLEQIDCVIHLAASMQGSASYQQQVGEQGTLRVLNAIRVSAVPRLVLLSSFSTLDLRGVPELCMVDEAAPTLAMLGKNTDLGDTAFGSYANTKASQERLVAKAVQWKSQQGLEALILRAGLVYDEQHLINGHAGFFKGSMHVLINHEGHVPVVQAGSLASAIVLAAESQGLQGCLHLVDDGLPSQADYWAGLRRRSLLAPGSLTLNWRSAQRLARAATGLGAALGVGAHVPEAFLPGSFASRFKPFRYSNTQARQHLGWRPVSGFF